MGSPRDLAEAQRILEVWRQVSEAADKAEFWTCWAAAALNLLDSLGLRNVEAAQRLLNDLRTLADARDDAEIWGGWARASFNLLVDLGVNDPDACKTLVSDMLRAVEKHPGPTGGWQTKIVGLVLNAAFHRHQRSCGARPEVGAGLLRRKARPA